MVRYAVNSFPLGTSKRRSSEKEGIGQMPGPLANSRHETFAQAVATGMSADAAYAAAGYKRHRGSATRLRANASIENRIKELLSLAARQTIKAIALTDADFISRLIREADYYGEGSSHGARVQAVKLIGDHLGLLKQRIEHGPTDGFAAALAEISRRGSAVPVASERQKWCVDAE